jgi:hypothetical protein
LVRLGITGFLEDLRTFEPHFEDLGRQAELVFRGGWQSGFEPEVAEILPRFQPDPVGKGSRRKDSSPSQSGMEASR